MSMEGMLDVYITDGSIDGGTFSEFIEKRLLPQLLPFNGTNARSVVVMDNPSIHHVEEVVTLIEDVGAIPIFLPPYSPDIMPIEECFSKVISYLRASDSLIQVLSESEMEDIILCAFTTTVEMDIFTVILFSLYSRLVNNREIKLTLIIQRQLQHYSISAAIVKIKYAK